MDSSNTYAEHAAFEAHEKLYGHPASDLPLRVREAYVAEGMPVPPAPRLKLAIHTPPSPGFCAHCGIPVDKKQHLAAHAVAGFEDAHGPDGELMRMLVTHCDEHWLSDFCSRDNITPGSGWVSAASKESPLVGSAGFCEALPSEVTLGSSLFPGAQYAGHFIKYALSALGLYLLSMGIVTSQGQQQANMGGPLANLIVPGTATSGQGFNAGFLRVLNGSAPGAGASAANAAETGILGIAWTMPATAFGASTAATPSVTTAGAVTNVNASASITAGYARLVEAADTTFALSTTLRRFQMTVGAGSGELSFNTLTISSGGACSVTSFTITHGA